MKEANYYSKIFNGLNIESVISFHYNKMINRLKPDILYLEDFGDDITSDLKITVIEVKMGKIDLLNALAQTLKYSLLANYCYLCIVLNSKDKGYSRKEIYLANQMGLGLMIFYKHKGNTLIITHSKEFLPLKVNVNKTVTALDLFNCSLCKQTFPLTDNKRKQNYFDYNVNPRAAILDKGVNSKIKKVFSDKTINQFRVLLCKWCHNNLTK